MPGRTLLLDVDGVLVRDKLLHEHMKDNIVRYVHSKVPTSKDPKRLNQSLYKTYGHTAKGLYEVFKVDSSDFDRRVYDKQLTNHLWSVITSNEFQQDAKIIHELSKYHTIKLFSNSPLVWTLPVAQAIGGVEVYENVHLKPDLRAYTRLPSHKKYMFVDDTLANLKPVRVLPNWIPVYYSQTDNSSEFPTVRNMMDIAMLMFIQ